MIFIYSGEVPVLDRRLSYELGANHRLLTIPYAADECWAAEDARNYFRSCGLNAHALSKAGCNNKEQLRNELFTADAVYLCGGNTYQFLAFARETGLFSLLKTFESLGGIVVAESAGSIILSPDISTAAIPTTCPDENTTDITDFQAMGRIAFHISPHFEPDSARVSSEMEELQTLANLSNTPVLLLEDGAGIVMQDDDIIFSTGSSAWVTATEMSPQQIALTGAANRQSLSHSLAG